MSPLYDAHVRMQPAVALIELHGRAEDIEPRLGRWHFDPLRPGQSSRRGDRWLMRPAPAWWVVIGPPGQGPELREELLSTPLDGDTLVVDLSDGWVHVAVTGVEAAELISAATAFDVHPRHFPAHGATFTDVLGLRALLRRRTDGFDIGFERSHAAYVMDWFARLQGHVAAPSATVDPGKSGGRT